MMNKALYIFFILLFLVNGVRAQNNLSDSSDKEAPFLTGYYYTSDQKEEKEFGYVVKEISRRKSVEYLGRKGSLPATFSFPSFPANIRLAFFFRNRKTEI